MYDFYLLLLIVAVCAVLGWLGFLAVVKAVKPTKSKDPPKTERAPAPVGAKLIISTKYRSFTITSDVLSIKREFDNLLDAKKQRTCAVVKTPDGPYAVDVGHHSTCFWVEAPD